MNLVIFGMQGSGKGTQAQIMAQRYQLASFETGAQCRRLAGENSALGKKIKKIVESGRLVSARIVIQILDNFLSHTPAEQGIIFDGIPRNLKQQQQFNKVLRKYKRKFLAINILIPEKETMKRLLARKRHDDTLAVIKNRLKIFYRNTQPMIEKLRRRKEIIDINGHQPIAAVAKEIHRQIDHHFLTK